MKQDLLASMKENILTQRGRLKIALVEQLKMQTKKGGIPAWRQIQALDNLHPLEMLKLQQEYGDEAVGNLIGGIYKLKADGRRKQ